MPEYRRAHHRSIVALLAALDAKFLQHCGCYFGGGTRLALLLDEYRESRDIDFLCSSRPGFRELRSAVESRSLGPIMRESLPMLDAGMTTPVARPALAREVRADRDGIRTVLALGDARIKFEIILEARLDLAGAMDPVLGVPVLSLEHAVAEKLLANADRGLDRSTLARDLVDLAFLAKSVEREILDAGMALAREAYGTAIEQSLLQSLDAFQQDRSWAKRSIESLGITDTATLRAGLRRLRRLQQRSD